MFGGHFKRKISNLEKENGYIFSEYWIIKNRLSCKKGGFLLFFNQAMPVHFGGLGNTQHL